MFYTIKKVTDGQNETASLAQTTQTVYVIFKDIATKKDILDAIAILDNLELEKLID